MTPGAADCTFVICVERGGLEYKALLFLTTLRRNFGRWANVPILAYAPREGRTPSPWMQEVYRRLDVTPVYEVLNREYTDYAYANKPLAAAHAEAVAKSTYLVFLDTDILCWREPVAFDLPDDVDLLLMPETTATVASSGPGTPYDDMWQAVYRDTGVDREPPAVVTTLTRERVRGWWLSGVTPVRREAGVMTQWLAAFRKIAAANYIVPRAALFREQIALCAVAAAMPERLGALPIEYNYPVQNFGTYRARGHAPEDAVLWHYQPFLNLFFRRFAAKVDAEPTIDGKLRLAEAAAERLRTNYPKLLGLDEPWPSRLRRRYRLGPRLRAALGMSKPTDAIV